MNKECEQLGRIYIGVSETEIFEINCVGEDWVFEKGKNINLVIIFKVMCLEIYF